MALQIRGDQLKDIADGSIKEGAAIQLDKLKLDDDATFSGALILSNSNTHQGVNTFSNDTDADGTNAAVKLSGGMNIAKKLYVGSDLTVTGNLVVSGTTTTINSTTISVDDKNFELGSVDSPDNDTADGGGLTLKGATDKEFKWVKSSLSWTSSEHMDIADGKEYKINNTKVLDSTSLGSAVVSSSLTSVGTISSGVWNGTAIENDYIANSSVTIGSTEVNLGGTAASLAGLTNITASAQIQFGTLNDGSVSIGGFVPATISGAGQTLENYDNDTTMPTTAAIIDYVGSKTSSSSLDLSAQVDDSSIEYTDSTLNVKEGGITNAMLAGSIANGKLSNSSLTVGSTNISLGGTSTTLAGLTSVSSTSFSGDLTGDVTGQVSDITNHASGSLSDVSYANALAQGDMLMVNSSGSLENVYEVIEYIDVDMGTGTGENQAVDISVDHDDDYESKALVFLNGQKLRYGADSSTNDFYFSAAGEITFQSGTLADGDSLEIRYIVAS